MSELDDIVRKVASHMAPKYEEERQSVVASMPFLSGPILGTKPPKIDGYSVCLFASSFPQSTVAAELFKGVTSHYREKLGR